MYLVRKKHPNKDKENNWVETFEQALTLIGQTKVKQFVSWPNYIDYFFWGNGWLYKREGKLKLFIDKQ